MSVGVITGSGMHALPDLEVVKTHEVDTPWGDSAVSEGRFRGVDVLHVFRHGEGHARLSSHVGFQANVCALKQLGARAVIGLTVCGAVARDVGLGSLVVFDDLHFLVNRLPGGEVCSFYQQVGAVGRGHWVFDRPYSEPLRQALLEGARAVGESIRDGGCYGHVDGPRFNSRAEIRSLALAGVVAVSQTGGPETVLCGEAELPYALMGYATDYANGVLETPTPVNELLELLERSTATFAAVLAAALPRVDTAALESTGTVLRF